MEVRNPEQMTNPIPFSVIVPAHDESAVIQRTLAAMLRDADKDGLEVIVVCNGCLDDTAERARSFGPPVQVLETDKGSKPLALNMGDAAARHFPRLFVDADIEVDYASLRAVADRLLESPLLCAAAPELRVNLEHASLLVRQYYSIWLRLPYVRNRLVGSGFYALSERGRQRFEQFPDIIGDDAFIHRMCELQERESVRRSAAGSPVFFIMTPPRSLRDLVHIETRRRASDDEMRELFGSASSKESESQKRALLRLFARPWLWPSLAVYLYVKLESRRRYRRNRQRDSHKEWHRDLSSRR